MDRSALLAHHYFGAGEYARAVDCWKAAAERAIERSALVEAYNLLQHALDALVYLSKIPELPMLELELTLELAGVLRSSYGYASPLAEKAYTRAREICLLIADDNKRFSIEWGLFQCNFVKCEMEVTREIAASLFEHASHHPERPIVDAQLAQGMVQYQLGELEGARNSFETAAELVHSEKSEKVHIFSHGQHPGTFCTSYLARTMWFLGYSTEARRIVERNVKAARVLMDDPLHLHSYVNALATAVGIYVNCREPRAVKQVGEMLMTISVRNHFTYYQALAEIDLGWAVSTDGNGAEGIDKMRRGIDALEKTATVNILPGYYVLLADALRSHSRYLEAMNVLERARNPQGTRVWDSEIERVSGQIFASMPNEHDAAEAAFLSAIEISRRQRACSLEWRAATAFAQFLKSSGRAEAGRSILEHCLEIAPKDLEIQDQLELRSSLKKIMNSMTENDFSAQDTRGIDEQPNIVLPN